MKSVICDSILRDAVKRDRRELGTTQGLGGMSDSILWRWIRNTHTLVVTHLVAKSLNQVHDHQDLQVQVPLYHHYLTNIIPHRRQNDQHRRFVFDHFVAGESVSVVDKNHSGNGTHPLGF